MDISAIKQELHANMNGVAAQAMRDAGMNADYRMNFGIELPRLQAICQELRETMLADADEEALVSIAQQLWKERVRECRILATMIYPPQRMLFDVADIWADDIRSVELAQIAALHLFQHIRHASQLAFQWIAGEQEMKQILGFYTLLHLIRKGQLNERSRQELADQANVCMQSDSVPLKMVVQKILNTLS